MTTKYVPCSVVRDPSDKEALDFQAQSTLTFRTSWHTPLHPGKATQAEFFEGVRQGFAEFTKRYNINFVERHGNEVADIYVISFPICDNAGAVWVRKPMTCYPWRGIYFASWDSRRWGVRYVKSVLMHEVLHVLEFNGTHYHSPDPKCVSNINATEEVFCPAEDAWLANRFGRRAPVVLPTITIDDVRLTRNNRTNTEFLFTIKLDKPSKDHVGVTWHTANGTARWEDGDYFPSGWNTVFPPGITERTIPVIVRPTQTNQTKTFQVNLTNAVNATIAKAQGIGTIDDPLLIETDFVGGGRGQAVFWQYRVTEPVTVTLQVNNLPPKVRQVTNTFGRVNELFGPFMSQRNKMRLTATNNQRTTFIEREINY